MSALTTTFVADLLNHYFTNAAHPSIGATAGLPGSTTAGNLYFALHATAPTDSGTQGDGEVGYTGYARAAVARTSGIGGFVVNAANKTVSPGGEVSFPKCNGATGATAYFWSLGTAAAGPGGYLVLRGGIGLAPRPCVVTTAAVANNAIFCPQHGLTANDPLVFFRYEDSALPSGITEGTVYFVKSVTDTDTITLTTTSGGAGTVSVGSAGQGICQKLTPLVITTNVTPKLETGTVIKFQ